jgi:hypothetical protein
VTIGGSFGLPAKWSEPVAEESIWNAVKQAELWFLESGIQADSGGVARHYRTDTREAAPVSSEITGYFVAALFMLHNLTGSEASFAAALRAADYLANQACDGAGQILAFEQSAAGRELAFFFDCGIAASALFKAWRRRGNAGHRRAALRIGASMLRDFGGNPGGFHPMVGRSTKQPLAYQNWWSKSPGCYQLKAASVWLDLSEEAGAATFRAAYEKTLEYALQDGEVFLNTNDPPGDTMDRLHAFGYFLEGALPVIDRRQAADALVAGIERMSSSLRQIAPVFARSDVYAQLLRLRLIGNARGVVQLNQVAAAEEVGAIREFQLESDDPRECGGFSFGRRAGRLMPFMSPVSTAFCVQALAMWGQHQLGLMESDWRSII